MPLGIKKLAPPLLALQALLFLDGCALARDSRSYWIAPAKGNATSGSGTENQPWLVANEQDFDRVMARMPENATIYLGPGIYETRGRQGFTLKTGQKLLGAGMGKTILRLTSPPKNYPLAVVLTTKDETAENIVIQDLTVDCNYSSPWGPITVQGVNLFGNFHTLRRVEVLRAAGFAQECFALGIGAHTIPSRGNLIEGCIVRNYVGGWCTAIYLVNNSCLHDPLNPCATYTQGIVRNNFVDLTKARFPKGGGCAYGGGGMDKALFEQNHSLGANFGFNFDTARLLNTRIINNNFQKCTYVGINARANRPGDKIYQLAILNNKIFLDPEPGQPSAFALAAGGNDKAPASELLIANNSFSAAPSPNTPCVGLILFGWQGQVTVTGNTFSKNLRNVFEPGPHYLIRQNGTQ